MQICRAIQHFQQKGKSNKHQVVDPDDFFPHPDQQAMHAFTYHMLVVEPERK